MTPVSSDRGRLTKLNEAAERKRVAYTIAEVAAMTGRDRTTIHRWLARGVLKAIRVPGGKRMVQAASLEKLLRVEGAGGNA